MTAAAQRVADSAREAAQKRLLHAAQFAALHCSRPLFRKTLRRPGCKPVVVQLDWPGVLRVFDPVTGELLAESEPGDPRRLRT